MKRKTNIFSGYLIFLVISSILIANITSIYFNPSNYIENESNKPSIIIDQVNPPTTLSSSGEIYYNTSDSLRDLADLNNINFGCSVSTWETWDPMYTKTLFREFNTMSTGYESMWVSVQPEQGQYNFQAFDDWVNMAKENNMTTIYRGEMLWMTSYPEWLAYTNSEGDLNQVSDWNRTELLAILDDYIETVVGRYKDDIDYWYIANEVIETPYFHAPPWTYDNYTTEMRHNFWYDIIGPDYLAYAYNKTREVAPDAKLFINEGCWWGNNPELADVRNQFFYDLVVDLLNQGVPIDGVGLQFYHGLDFYYTEYWYQYINHTQFSEQIRMFTDLGLEVHISETGCAMLPPVSQEKLQEQAEIYQNLTKLVLDHENVTTIVIWGMNDYILWMLDEELTAPHLFWENNERKPAYYAVQHLLQGNDSIYQHDFDNPLINPPSTSPRDMVYGLDPPYLAEYQILTANYNNTGSWEWKDGEYVFENLTSGDHFWVNIKQLSGYQLYYNFSDYFKIDISIDEIDNVYNGDYSDYDTGHFIWGVDYYFNPAWCNMVMSESSRFPWEDWCDSLDLHSLTLFGDPELEFINNETSFGYIAANENYSLHFQWNKNTGILEYYNYNYTAGDTFPIDFEFIRLDDIEPPSWNPPPSDRMIEFGMDFSYQVEATDIFGIMNYEINNTINFVIDGNGLISNNTSLSVGTYWLQVFAYDTSNNNCSIIFKIMVIPKASPTWSPNPSGQVIEYGEALFYDVDAIDFSGIDHYWINDTINFGINSNGLITISAILDSGTYWLEIRAYDPGDNYCYIIISITVEGKPKPSDEIPWYGLDFFTILGISALITVVGLKMKIKQHN